MMSTCLSLIKQFVFYFCSNYLYDKCFGVDPIDKRKYTKRLLAGVVYACLIWLILITSRNQVTSYLLWMLTLFVCGIVRIIKGETKICPMLRAMGLLYIINISCSMLSVWIGALIKEYILPKADMEIGYVLFTALFAVLDAFVCKLPIQKLFVKSRKRTKEQTKKFIKGMAPSTIAFTFAAIASVFIGLKKTYMRGLMDGMLVVAVTGFLGIGIYSFVKFRLAERRHQKEQKEQQEILEEYERKEAELRKENEKLHVKQHETNSIIRDIRRELDAQRMEAGMDMAMLEDSVKMLEDQACIDGQKNRARKNTCQKTGIRKIDVVFARHCEAAKLDGIVFEMMVKTPLVPLFKACAVPPEILAMVLENLLSNTRDFVLKREHIGKRIRIIMGLTEASVYEIAIFDTGLPFAREVLEHFGERGMTTRPEESDQGKGTGLGLFTVVEAMKTYDFGLRLEQFDGEEFTKVIRLVFGKGYFLELPEGGVRQAETAHV